jgi:hypothetical protein
MADRATYQMSYRSLPETSLCFNTPLRRFRRLEQGLSLKKLQRSRIFSSLNYSIVWRYSWYLVQPCRTFLYCKTSRIQAFCFTLTLNFSRGCFCHSFSFCFLCLWTLHGDSIDRRRRATACFSQISWDLRQRSSICSSVKLNLNPPVGWINFLISVKHSPGQVIRKPSSPHVTG